MLHLLSNTTFSEPIIKDIQPLLCFGVKTNLPIVLSDLKSKADSVSFLFLLPNFLLKSVFMIPFLLVQTQTRDVSVEINSVWYLRSMLAAIATLNPRWEKTRKPPLLEP